MRAEGEKDEEGKIIVPGTIYSRAGRGFRGDPSNMKQTKNEKFFLCGPLEVHPPAGGLHASGVLVNLRSAGKQRLKYNVAMARRESAGNFRDSGLSKVVRHVAERGNENARKWENPGHCATFVPKIPESLTKRRAVSERNGGKRVFYEPGRSEFVDRVHSTRWALARLCQGQTMSRPSFMIMRNVGTGGSGTIYDWTTLRARGSDPSRPPTFHL